MKKLLVLLPLVVVATATLACQQAVVEDELMVTAQATFAVVPDVPPMLAETPMTDETIELG